MAEESTPIKSYSDLYIFVAKKLLELLYLSDTFKKIEETRRDSKSFLDQKVLRWKEANTAPPDPFENLDDYSRYCLQKINEWYDEEIKAIKQELEERLTQITTVNAQGLVRRKKIRAQ